LKNKSADFIGYLTDINADVVAVTERWSNNCECAAKIGCTSPRYTLLDEPCIGRFGGGTAMKRTLENV